MLDAPLPPLSITDSTRLNICVSGCECNLLVCLVYHAVECPLLSNGRALDRTSTVRILFLPCDLWLKMNVEVMNSLLFCLLNKTFIRLLNYIRKYYNEVFVCDICITTQLQCYTVDEREVIIITFCMVWMSMLSFSEQADLLRLSALYFSQLSEPLLVPETSTVSWKSKFNLN